MHSSHPALATGVMEALVSELHGAVSNVFVASEVGHVLEGLIARVERGREAEQRAELRAAVTVARRRLQSVATRCVRNRASVVERARQAAALRVALTSEVSRVATELRAKAKLESELVAAQATLEDTEARANQLQRELDEEKKRSEESTTKYNELQAAASATQQELKTLQQNTQSQRCGDVLFFRLRRGPLMRVFQFLQARCSLFIVHAVCCVPGVCMCMCVCLITGVAHALPPQPNDVLALAATSWSMYRRIDAVFSSTQEDVAPNGGAAVDRFGGDGAAPGSPSPTAGAAGAGSGAPVSPSPALTLQSPSRGRPLSARVSADLPLHREAGLEGMGSLTPTHLRRGQASRAQQQQRRASSFSFNPGSPRRDGDRGGSDGRHLSAHAARRQVAALRGALQQVGHQCGGGGLGMQRGVTWLLHAV